MTKLFGIIAKQAKQILLQAAIFTATMSASYAGGLQGHWQQASSNAGDCDTCTLEVAALSADYSRDFAEFLVSANNGWSAQVTPSSNDGEFANGYGRWDDSVGGAYAGKRFQITLLEEQDTMRMVMQMLDRSLPNAVVASFNRAHLDDRFSERYDYEAPYKAASWGGIIRSGPGMQYNRIASLAQGQAVTILHRTSQVMNGYPWMLVEYGNAGHRGYQWGGILCATDYDRQDLHQICEEPDYHDARPQTHIPNNDFGPANYSADLSQRFSYSCEDGSRLTYQLDNRAAETLAILDFKGRRHHLVQVVSASGSFYSNGQIDFSSKSETALVTTEDLFLHCTSR